MGLLGLFLSAFVIGFSGAMMPGPLMAVTIRHGIQSGPWAGLAVSIGHAIVELAVLVALVLGLGRILALPQVTSTIAVLGALVLAWMAWGAFQEARSGSAGWTVASASENAATASFSDSPTRGRKTSWLLILGAGVAATATNPYWVLWWATIGAGMVSMAQTQGVPGLGVFFTGHISADIFCFVLFAVAASTGQRLLGQRFYRGMMLVLSFCLVLLALYFIYSAFFNR